MDWHLRFIMLNARKYYLGSEVKYWDQVLNQFFCFDFGFTSPGLSNPSVVIVYLGIDPA